MNAIFWRERERFLTRHKSAFSAFPGITVCSYQFILLSSYPCHTNLVAIIEILIRASCLWFLFECDDWLHLPKSIGFIQNTKLHISCTLPSKLKDSLVNQALTVKLWLLIHVVSHHPHTKDKAACWAIRLASTQVSLEVYIGHPDRGVKANNNPARDFIWPFPHPVPTSFTFSLVPVDTPAFPPTGIETRCRPSCPERTGRGWWGVSLRSWVRCLHISQNNRNQIWSR